MWRYRKILLPTFLSLTRNESVALVFPRGAAWGAQARMRVVQRVLGSIARQALVCKEALPRKSSAEPGKLGAAAPHEGVAELGGFSWAICNLQVMGRVDQLGFFNTQISRRAFDAKKPARLAGAPVSSGEKKTKSDTCPLRTGPALD